MIRKVELNLQSGVSGAWKVARYTVTPQGAKMHNLREIFNGRNRFINAGEYWGLFRNGKIIMSNTPAEINDQDLIKQYGQEICRRFNEFPQDQKL